MWNIITLDGYFEGNTNWELPFHERIWGPELEEKSIDQLNRADYLVFGRVTYAGMAAYWGNAEGQIAEMMNSLPKIVFSRTLISADWNNSTLIRGNAPEEVARLKAEGNNDMYVFGSANLSETLIRSSLFDEYRIGIAPVLLGQGRHLFSENLQANLDLKNVEQLSNGGVILTYIPHNQ